MTTKASDTPSLRSCLTYPERVSRVENEEGAERRGLSLVCTGRGFGPHIV